MKVKTGLGAFMPSSQKMDQAYSTASQGCMGIMCRMGHLPCSLTRGILSMLRVPDTMDIIMHTHLYEKMTSSTICIMLGVILQL